MIKKTILYYFYFTNQIKNHLKKYLQYFQYTYDKILKLAASLIIYLFNKVLKDPNNQ